MSPSPASTTAAPVGSRITRLSSWLGGRTIGALPGNTAAPRDADPELFARIGAFLDRHDLAPTVDHFRIARGYVLGEDVGTACAIDRHVAEHGSIDAAALARLTGATALDPLDPERIAEMAQALAARLVDAEGTFHQSHASARDYEHALTAEVDTAGDDPDATVKRLLALTTEAIARTQQLAGRLQETHRETRQLRDHLEEAQRAADEDHLTSLANRRCYDARLRALILTGDPRSTHCVALCDIDDFKAINDRHGHDTGDRVLKLVADRLTKDLGTTAFVARHGGEEFACLFEDCMPNDALVRLDDVREALSARSLVNQTTGEGLGRLTFSAGIAVLGTDPAAAMRSADGALYTAKREGKNRILIA